MMEYNEKTILQREQRMVCILIFCALFIIAASFHQPVDYDNTSSRYFLVSAIVDHGTFSIDANEKETIDKSFFNGHYYSNKAIGAPLLGVPIYWCLRRLPFLKESVPLAPFSKYIVRIFTTTLPFALLGVVMFCLACKAGASPRKAFFMVIAYGFGTIALIHATLFSGHQVAASFAFFAFALVFQQSGNNMNQNNSVQSIKYFMAGLFAGLAAISDYPAVIVTFFLTIYVFSLRPLARNLFLYILGGLICATLVAAYNMHCFDNPISMSYSNLAFEKFREEANIGLFGINLPEFKIMTAILFSLSRGLLVIMPVLLLSFMGLGRMYMNEKYRKEAFLIVAICFTYIFFNSGYCGWHGGWTFGPRYLVPMLPFLVFTMAFGGWSSFSFMILFLLSVFQVFPAIAGMPHTPEDIRNPLVEIIIPCMGQGYLARNAGMFFKLPGLLSIIPIMVVVAVIMLVAFRKIKAVEEQVLEHTREFPRFVIYLWLLVIVCMLTFTVTTPEKIIHAYRWRLLCHAGWTLNSPELMKASDREAALAGDLPK
ncbi:MAG: hypothetical protein PHR77_17845 [Kiritimatiellae bacterium]|nr:hypothetical protein [Kiritimatiellia bacterium]MDD5522846.1 hypothetical protein [Kiritimatiellia bacterium]